MTGELMVPGLAAHVVAATATTTTPSPSPTPVRTPDPDSVTPGVLGFLAIFLLAVATLLLMRNLTSRLRRLRYREDQRLLDERRAAAGDNEGTDPPQST